MSIFIWKILPFNPALVQDRFESFVSVVAPVAESYSVRDARLHLRHVRDLLRSLDPTDAYNGVNGSSLSYLTFYTTGNNGNAPLSYIRISFPIRKHSTLSPLRSTLQMVRAWGRGELLKGSLLTAALQNTSSPALRSDRCVHFNQSERTGR